MGLACFVLRLIVPLLLDCFLGSSHMVEECPRHTGMPDRNSQFCTIANLCLEVVVLEGKNRVLNTVFLGEIWNWRALG
jgi:hypothetical protein